MLIFGCQFFPLHPPRKDYFRVIVPPGFFIFSAPNAADGLLCSSEDSGTGFAPGTLTNITLLPDTGNRYLSTPLFAD